MEEDKRWKNIIDINEYQDKDHLGEMVRSTVEWTLNPMLDTDAKKLCNAQKTEKRQHPNAIGRKSVRFAFLEQSCQLPIG